MRRGFRCVLSGLVVVVALVALAGCSHSWLAQRESWRHDAEIACLNSGAVKETPQRVRISAINGPGICGADFPLRVSALGDTGPLGYDDEANRPPSSIPNGAMPQRWPVAQPPPYDPQFEPPLSLTPSGIPEPDEDANLLPGPPGSYSTAPLPPPGRSATPYPSTYPERQGPPRFGGEPSVPPGPPPALPPSYPPPLGPQGSMGVAGVGPVEVRPAATLACPIVSALDRWIGNAVQPAALRWFRQPVVGIKQISAYSCRGMNGNPNARISEHAFGNALDIAEFDLADGHRISVQHGWHGSPEEQGFLHDVLLAACQEFTTVLAPGANVYHYNHIHVDLMRHSSRRRHICEPSAVPGDVVAERARARYAAQHYRDQAVTGSIGSRTRPRGLGYSVEDDDRLPLAVPGDD